MSIIFISGDHPRHRYVASCLWEKGLLDGWIIEAREAFVPQAPPELKKSLRTLFKHHFDERERVETVFFGDAEQPNVKTLRVTTDRLNSEDVECFIGALVPRLVISFGCHWLDVARLGGSDIPFWNIHGGLSPDYRGAITHFWPSYFLEPQMTGITLHETTPKLDAGAILMQTAAPLVRGDGLHSLAARCVLEFGKRLSEKLALLDRENIPGGVPQTRGGRLFLATDWRPEHLRLIYDFYDDAIVDEVLSGHLVGREPALIDVL